MKSKTKTSAVYFAMGVKAFCIEHLKKEGDNITINRSDLERLEKKVIAHIEKLTVKKK